MQFSVILEYLLVAVIALQLADWGTTWALLRSGKGREANPVLALLMRLFGTYTALAAAKIAGVVLAVSSYFALDALGLLLVGIFYLVIVGNNYRLMKKFNVKGI